MRRAIMMEIPAFRRKFSLTKHQIEALRNIAAAPMEVSQRRAEGCVTQRLASSLVNHGLVTEMPRVKNKAMLPKVKITELGRKTLEAMG